MLSTGMPDASRSPGALWWHGPARPSPSASGAAIPPQEITIPPANPYTLLVQDFQNALTTGHPMRLDLNETLCNLHTLDSLAEAAQKIRVL